MGIEAGLIILEGNEDISIELLVMRCFESWLIPATSSG